jgi:hypothetical protein
MTTVDSNIIRLRGPEKEETEMCILCHEDTGILRKLHIDDPGRGGNYIEGAGQLCKNCADSFSN